MPAHRRAPDGERRGARRLSLAAGRRAGATRVLCVAGDIAKAEGEFDSALQILERGFFEKHGIKKIGVAGHPEGHKEAPANALKDAIVRKNAYAQKTGADLRLVTQFSFVAEPVIAWEKTLAPINTLPVFVGLPGLQGEHAAEICARLRRRPLVAGVFEHATQLSKLLTVSAPDEQRVALASHRAQNLQNRHQGSHFFPFGGLKRPPNGLWNSPTASSSSRPTAA